MLSFREFFVHWQIQSAKKFDLIINSPFTFHKIISKRAYQPKHGIIILGQIAKRQLPPAREKILINASASRKMGHTTIYNMCTNGCTCQFGLVSVQCPFFEIYSMHFW
jgi:hypothetical protein